MILNSINPEWLEFFMEHTVHLGGGATVFCYARYVVYGRWTNPSDDPEEEMRIETEEGEDPICLN